MRHGWLIPLALLGLTHATGVVTVGLVTTGSMEPTLPVGTLFLSHASDPTQGDIVVYSHPEGHQVVHRVVDVTPEGLITQGDANDRTDQAAGVPPVDPDTATVVPTVAGRPAAVSSDLFKPLAILGGQVLLLTYAARTFLRGADDEGLGWPLNRLEPSHLLFAAGLFLLAVSPLLAETLHARGHIELQGMLLPTLATVDGDGVAQQRTLAPLATTTVPAEGHVKVVRAPALPGASVLASFGAAWAMLPTAVTVWTGGLLLRRRGH